MRRTTTKLFYAIVRDLVADMLPTYSEKRYDIGDIANLIYRHQRDDGAWAFLAFLARRGNECFTVECALSQDGEFPFDAAIASPRPFESVGRSADPFIGAAYRFRLVSLWEPQDQWFCLGAAAWRTSRLPFMGELRMVLAAAAPELPSDEILLTAEIRCAIMAFEYKALPFLYALPGAARS